MAERHREFISENVEIIAILNDSAENAQAYFQRHAIPFPCLIDTEHTVYDLYQVGSRVISLGQRPGLFVIDRGGTVRYSHVGWQQWDIPKNADVLGVCQSIHCQTS